jgi:radical SAM protein with 4Fe4S-binding SPASM domain
VLELNKKINQSSSGLYEIVVGITSKCNFNCKFCYSNSSNKNISSLSLETIVKIFDQAKELGVQIIAISGGEPLLHDNIFEILEYAKRSCPILMLSTNGFFINKEVAHKLKDIGVDNVQLSIEGREEVNDELRGIKGAYKNTVFALKYLREEGIDVTITPTIQKENFDNIYYIWDLAKKYNADISIKRMIETGRADVLENITPERYKELYDFAIEENKKNQKSRIFIHCDPLRVLYKDQQEINFSRFSGCIAGKALLYIKYNGDVYPCSKLPIKCGNIYEKKLKDIFLNSRELKKLTTRENLKGKCRDCKYNLICGGCRASAYAKYNDYMEEDPLCWKNYDLKYPLYYLTWNVTNSCNLKCEHCYANSGTNTENELTTQEAIKMINQAKQLGVNFLLFTGGEPLRRKDLFSLIKYSKSRDITNFLATNGTLLTEDQLPDIKKYVDKVNISIDFPEADLHDNFRGVNGAFKKSIHAIKLLKSNNIPVSVSTTACNANIEHIESIIALCKDLDIPLNIKRLINIGRSEKSRLYFSKTEYFKLKKILKQNKYKKVTYKDPMYNCEIEHVVEKKLGGCLAGIHILSITSTGDVQICTKVFQKIDNIRENSLIDIWRKNELLKKLRERELSGKCATCENILVCGGCRAAAYQKYQDVLASDPLCEEVGI